MARPRKPESELTPEQLKRRERNDRYLERRKKEKSPIKKPAVLSLAPPLLAPSLELEEKQMPVPCKKPQNKYNEVLDTVLNCPKLTIMALSIISSGVFLGHGQFELYHDKGFGIATSVFLAAIFEIWLLLLAALNSNKLRNIAIIGLIAYSSTAFYLGTENSIQADTQSSTSYQLLAQGLQDAKRSWKEAKAKKESGNMKYYYKEKIRYENELKNYNYSSHSNSSVFNYSLLIARIALMLLNLFAVHYLIASFRHKKSTCLI